MVLFTVLLSLLLLPIVLSQNITVEPSTPPEVKKPVNMNCSDSLMVADALVWSFRPQPEVEFIPLSNLTGFTLSETSTNGILHSSWARNFELSIGGTYMCESRLSGVLVGNSTRLLTSRIIYEDEHNEPDVEVYINYPRLEIKCRFQSSPTELFLTVSWCFQLYRYPRVNVSSCNALPNNSEVFALTPSENLTSSNIYNATVLITNITFDNAGFYQCSLSNGFSNLTKGVRVRVRDNMEILWPAVGIMVQLVIITMFITMHYIRDSYKDKQKKIEREKKEDQNLVTSGTVENVLEDEPPSNELLIKVIPTT